VIIFSLFFLISFLSHENDFKALIMTALSTFGFVLFVGLLSFFKKETVLESYTIRLKHDCIAREGSLYPSDSINTQIYLTNIEKLKKTTNGCLLYEKGRRKSFKFDPYKMVGIYDKDIIWIPYILTNYKELTEFLRRIERQQSL
jgi:hypothetical protein